VHRVPFLLLVLLTLAVIHAADELTPAFIRLDLTAGERRAVLLTLVLSTEATVLAAESDCACLRLLTPLPLRVIAGVPTALQAEAVGVRAGLKTLILRTTTGVLRSSVHLVTPGLGTGRSELSVIAAEQRAAAPDSGLEVWFVLHDLRGELRNCGCSGGSLGGLDILAALPRTWAEVSHGGVARFLLSGDIEGRRPGVESTLVGSGWGRDRDRVDAPADMDKAMMALHPRLIVPPPAVTVEHARLIRPLLDRGLTVAVALVPRAGAPTVIHHLPIDRTLPAQPGLIEQFPDRLSVTIVPPPRTTDCANCHASAQAVWQTSRHAVALASLASADRTDGCISCHTSPGGEVQTRVADVGCTACHPGGPIHAQARAAGRTTGTGPTVDCRSCHDQKHDPAFDVLARWRHIAHTR